MTYLLLYIIISRYKLALYKNRCLDKKKKQQKTCEIAQSGTAPP